MLNPAIEDGLIASNPAANLGRVLKLGVSRSTTQEEIKALTKEQRQLFLATTYKSAPRYYPSKSIRIDRAFSEDGALDTPKSAGFWNENGPNSDRARAVLSRIYDGAGDPD
jgi:hypothetical protein